MQGNDGLMMHPAVSWLPDPCHEAVVDDRKVEAFMDWGRGNLAFTLSNYRALESVLAHMPNTVLRVQSIAQVRVCLCVVFRDVQVLLRFSPACLTTRRSTSTRSLLPCSSSR